MPADNSAAPRRCAERAPAKVNLFLRVTGRRADGYHELQSLAVFAGAGDIVSCAPSDRLALDVTGPFSSGLGNAPDNLVLRAARALAPYAAVPATARLTLEKHLPVASGIGGGSADAAPTQRGLAGYWGIGAIPPGLALALGADVPVCIESRPAIMRGVGDVLLPAPALPDFGLALVNPGLGVATAEVFRARQGVFSPVADLPLSWPTASAMARDVAAMGNDLQTPAMAICPAIGAVLAALGAVPGCLLAQMSGSGATCFGLFATAAEAAHAAKVMEGHAGWWAWGGAPQPPHARGLPEPTACP